jgi:carbon-monoxide dehydrogenase medium subunit
MDVDPGGRVSAAALSFFGAGSTPVRVSEAEGLLGGHPPSEDLFAEAAETVKKALDPPGDLHGSAAYRRHIGPVLTRRCLQEAAGRLGVPA